jgi:Ras-related C3 botulinum toxin substrate 1
MSENDVLDVKCVLVGDSDVGTTCLLYTYTTKQFPEWVPTVFDNCSASVVVDGRDVCLGLWDTAGQEGYNRLAPLTYPSTDVFILCFTIDSPTSFHNIKEKWLCEIHHHAPGVPVILAGLKSDLRNNATNTQDEEIALITQAQGEALCEEIKAFKYLECSALTQEGISALFDEVARCALVFENKKPHKDRKKSKCLIS